MLSGVTYTVLVQNKTAENCRSVGTGVWAEGIQWS